MVGLLILVEQVQVIGKVLGNAGHLDVLPHHLPVRPEPQLLIGVQQLAQVLPAPGGGELQPVRRILDAVEAVLPDVKIREDCPVEAPPPGILFPDAVVLLHIDALHPVQRHHVEVPDGLVVLRRVARRHDEPPLRQLLIAEGLALEELEHHGGQGLGDAVDLVQEEDALLQAGALHQPVDGGEDLAHGVLGDGDLLPAVGPLFDEGQADGALPCVVGDGVGHQPYTGLGGDLLHDLGLAHAGRAHQQHRPLAHRGDQIVPQLVPGQIRLQGIGDLLLCLFDVHIRTPYSWGSSSRSMPSSSSAASRAARSRAGVGTTSRMAQGGILMERGGSSSSTKAVSQGGRFRG